MQDLVASGQLKLSRVPSERNPADALTKYLQASTLHKLLPKLGVMTRAADSKDLLSVISFDGRVSSQPTTSSFFIGMLAEQHVSAQLVASRAYSRRSLATRSLRPESQQEDQPTPTSFTWSSFRWFYVCSATLLCLPFFFQIFDFKLYGALLSGMMVAVQLCVRISFVLEQVALRTRTAATALRTLSSVALGSLSTPKSLIRTLLATFLVAWVALLCQNKSLILSASFAQSESFSSLPSLCFSSFCFASSSPASACNMSLASAASDLPSSAASAYSFSHEQATMLQLHNEAYSLPEALLVHSLKATILNRQLEALPDKLDAQQFQSFLPKLDKKSLRFWMILHKEAFDEFKLSNFDMLPRQRCAASRNANLGNWQASSSFAKQLGFYAWITNRYPKLAEQEAFMMSFDLEPASFAASASAMELGGTVSLDYRGADTQLVWWGKLSPSASQSLQQLGVSLGAYIYKIPSFSSLEHLFSSSSFDWSGSSSSWQLSKNWKLDSEVHPEVYWKLTEELGAASPLGKLIKVQLENSASQQPTPASGTQGSPALTAFWKKQAKLMAKSLHTTLDNVEALLYDREAEAFFAEAWSEEELPPTASEEPAGRFDGSELAL